MANLACRVCGDDWDVHFEHGTNFAARQKPPEATAHADANPAETTEPRGRTTNTSRPADIFTIAAVPGRSAALDVCVRVSRRCGCDA